MIGLETKSKHYSAVKELMYVLYDNSREHQPEVDKSIRMKISEYPLSEEEKEKIKEEIMTEIRQENERRLKLSLAEALSMYGNGHRLEDSSKTA